MSLDAVQRWRVPIACMVIVLLLVLLAVREGLAHWRELAQWQALAQSAASLGKGPALTLERLHQAAQSRQVTLMDVQLRDELWHVQGHVADEAGLGRLLLALQGEGALPVQWGLKQAADGLHFDLVVRP